MAYEVTATRRRPQKFGDLVGQEFVASTLTNSINSGKIAHAYLFSGPRGCGKTSTARILAKVLNCTAGPENAPCGECTACKEIAKGTSLDVIEIDGASNTSVNDVRQIKDEVLFPPNSCKYKIYIIDEVHMLSNSAFNALLKTIEEPPPYVIFIFATTELHKVPATIKSRCQQFHFRLGSVEQIKELLAKTCQELGITAEDEALYWVAREATGSFRDAYTLFDQVAAFSDGHITYDKIRDKLGIVSVEQLNELAENCCKGDSQKALTMIEQFVSDGIPIEQLITNLSDYFRSLLFIQAGITKESLLGQNVQRYSQLVLQTWNSVQLERALSMFLQLYRDIRYSLAVRYELDLAITKLCWLSSYVSSSEVKAAIDATKALFSQAGIIANNAQKQQISQNSMQNGFQKPASNLNAQQSWQPQTKILEQGQNWQSQPVQNQQSKPVGLYQFSNLQNSQSQQNEANSPFVDGGSFSEDGISVAQLQTNPNLTIEEVKQLVIENQKELQNAFVVTALQSSEDWQLFENSLIIPVTNPLNEKTINPQISAIATYIHQIWGKTLSIKVKYHAPVEVQNQVEYPLPVKTVLETLGGTVVSVQDASTIEHVQPEQTGQTEATDDQENDTSEDYSTSDYSDNEDYSDDED